MRIFVAIWVFCVVSSTYAGESIGTAQQAYHVLSELEERGDLSRGFQALPAQTKDSIIRVLKSDEKARENVNLLYQLGDRDALERVVSYFYSTEGMDGMNTTILSKTGNPETISRLSVALLREEPYKRFGTDGFTYPISFNAARTILKTIANATVFRGDVIGWAREFNLEAPPNDSMRDIIREWWHTNEGFFERGEYQFVLPGRSLKDHGETTASVPPPSRVIRSSAPHEKSRTIDAVSKGPTSGSGNPHLANGFLIVAALSLGLIPFLVVFFKRLR